MTTQTRHCAKCNMAITVTAKCDCNVGYITAGDAAARAVAAHPERSDRSIAKEIGVDHKTVSAARKATERNSPVDGSQKCSTGEFSPVARKGLDGKTRRMPKPKYKHSPEVRQAAAEAVLDEGKTWKEVQAELGISSTVIRTSVAEEEGKRSVPLSKSEREKLALFERQVRKELEAEFQKKLDDAIMGYEWEQVFPMLKQYRDEAQKIVEAERKGIWSNKTFLLMMLCVHPDTALAASAEKRNQAVRILNHYRNVLVSFHKDDPNRPQPPRLPRTKAEWEILKRRTQEERRRQREASRMVGGVARSVH